MKLAAWIAAGVVLAGQTALGTETAQPVAGVPFSLKDMEGVANGRAGRLKANGDTTMGAYSLVVRGPYNAPGPEAHTHSHLTEAWLVTEGALKFQTRERVIDAPAGTFVRVPPGVDHRFWSEPGQQIKVVQLISPPGFEKFFDERLKLPGYDPDRSQAEQSAQWKRAAADLSRKYGGGPADQHSDQLPEVIGKEEGWSSASNNDEMHRVLMSFKDTHGSYQVLERVFNPGKPFPWSASSQDNAYYVVDGTFIVQLRDRQFALTTGDFVFVPRKTEYRLHNASASSADVLIVSSNGPPQPREAH